MVLMRVPSKSKIIVIEIQTKIVCKDTHFSLFVQIELVFPLDTSVLLFRHLREKMDIYRVSKKNDRQ